MVMGMPEKNRWPAAKASVMDECKPKLKTLEFDPMGIDEDDLLNLALEIFLEIGVHQGLGIETEKIQGFLLGVRDRMLENPFHNWAHVFDVTQTCYALVLLSKGRDHLSDMQVFGLMIATLCHDLEHPGVNNQFLVKSKSSLATLYNNESILEKHHAFRAFELMLHPGIDLLSAFSKDEYDAFRQLVMSLILATDMARHNEYVVNLKTHAKGQGAPGLDPLLYMELLLKCADISDGLKPFDITKKWTLRITDEFFLQGDMERASGMDVSCMCDRTSQSRVAVQKGMIDYIVLPFCTLLAEVIPALQEAFGQIAMNRSIWDTYDDALLLEEVGKKDTGLMKAATPLRVVTWNIAAVNNNPFEYWVTHGQTSQSEGYAQLMTDVQMLIDNPETRDFKVGDVVTDDMIQELVASLTEHGCGGVELLLDVWRAEYKDRYAIAGFLKDKGIGSKRLISMPDRISNTINSEGTVLMRPSVISMFNDEGLSTTAGWWELWKQYIFSTQVKVLDRNKPNHFNYLFVVGMMQKISRHKYPAITEAEEAMSIPLQLMALAIFDGVLLHILNTLAPETWQPIKVSLCEAFNQNKGQKVISILERSYSDADVIFIQEAAAAFVEAAKQGLGRKYMILRPYLLDGFRNQNSIILAKRVFFVEGSTIDVTEHVIRLAGGGKWIAAGDLCAMTMQGLDGKRYFLASFHGDTNGMASLPVLRALNEAISTYYPDHVLICGMDANTHKKHSDSTQGFQNFHESFMDMGMVSCWGLSPSLSTWTTRNARTYLQPQLQKAVGIADVASKGDTNLKDWIVFHSGLMEASQEQRDNTGERHFREDMVFPTLNFPSDHAIVSVLCTRIDADLAPSCNHNTL
mmetsp:Transcript_36321/g.58576  ORF Transcript_36321/g.58576 Transcript_36321/m.58576 type:complete len:859 (+) Transcript_36321:178-2754(+)